MLYCRDAGQAAWWATPVDTLVKWKLVPATQLIRTGWHFHNKRTPHYRFPRVAFSKASQTQCVLSDLSGPPSTDSSHPRALPYAKFGTAILGESQLTVRLPPDVCEASQSSRASEAEGLSWGSWSWSQEQVQLLQRNPSTTEMWLYPPIEMTPK